MTRTILALGPTLLLATSTTAAEAGDVASVINSPRGRSYQLGTK
jgi:hypothetical protein